MFDKIILMIQYITTLTQKGQATIPAPIRKKLGLKSGEKIMFEEKNNQILIKKVIGLSQLQGSLKSKIKFDDQKADKAIGEMIAREYGQTG